eukprot:6450300-Pyramimonas_sp.AAC.1
MWGEFRGFHSARRLRRDFPSVPLPCWCRELLTDSSTGGGYSAASAAPAVSAVVSRSFPLACWCS